MKSKPIAWEFKLICLVMTLVALAACGSAPTVKAWAPSPSSKDSVFPTTQSDQRGSAPMPDGSPSGELPEANDAAVQKALALFKTKVDIDSSFFSGACKDVLDNAAAVGAKNVPEELKVFLAKELAASPFAKLLGPGLLGIYIVDLRYGTLTRDVSAGLACASNKGDKFYAALSYDALIKERQTLKLPMNGFAPFVYSSEYLVEDLTDATVYALFHELVHVLDFQNHLKLYADGSSDPTPERLTLADFSWSGYDTDIFDIARNLKTYDLPRSAASLVGSTTGGAIFCGQRPLSQTAGLNLAVNNPTGKDYVSDYEFLEKVTNFYTFYAGTNALEDLAETLAHYYIGTRYKVWPTTKVYENGDRKTPIFVHDPSKQFANASSSIHKKTCAAVQTVLKSSCP